MITDDQSMLKARRLLYQSQCCCWILKLREHEQKLHDACLRLHITCISGASLWPSKFMTIPDMWLTRCCDPWSPEYKFNPKHWHHLWNGLLSPRPLQTLTHTLWQQWLKYFFSLFTQTLHIAQNMASGLITSKNCMLWSWLPHPKSIGQLNYLMVWYGTTQ